MDSRLLKALTANRIAIVRKFTKTKSNTDENPGLLDRLQNRSFKDTEDAILALDQLNFPPAAKKLNWIERMLERFGSKG